MDNNSKKREKTIIRTSIIGISGNVLLVGFKAMIGLLAHSVSIFMDALNNLTDVLSSVITIIGTKLSNKKPDKKHPFGHGRIEYITSTLIALLVLFAGGLAIYESIVSIVEYFTSEDPTLPTFTIWSLIIIGAGVLVKVGIGIFYRIQGKSVKSSSLLASGMDALFDAALSFATLVGAIMAYTLHWYVEGYLGIIIGIFIIKTGIEILRDSFSSIIGERHDQEETKAMIADINSIDGVQGAYDLILNNYGPNKNIGSVHIGVDANMTAKDIQRIEREINILMYQKYSTFMTVGIYAVGIENDRGNQVFDKLADLIKDEPTILQMHGFFIDEKTKVINFDLVISFDDKEPEVTAKRIQGALENEFNEFTFIIQIDKDYSLS